MEGGKGGGKSRVKGALVEYRKEGGGLKVNNFLFKIKDLTIIFK